MNQYAEINHDDYLEAIEKAQLIQQQYLQLIKPITNKVGTHQSKYHPDIRVKCQAKNLIYSTGKLAGQILSATKQGYLQLSVVGLRTLFELSVNSIYIFNHPKKKGDLKHMRKLCSEIFRLDNKRRRVNHSKLEGSFKDRLQAIGMGALYHKHYRILSTWAHLMNRTVIIDTDPKQAYAMAIGVAIGTLQALHNTFDSVAAYAGYTIPEDLEITTKKYCDSFGS